MDHLRKLLYRRRSTRRFLDRPVSREDLDAVVEAALLAPTGRSKRTCRFMTVRDRRTLHALSGVKEHGSALLAGASCCVVVLADDEQTDVWIEDASIATFAMQLMAEELGLGSCWVQIRNRFEDAQGRVRSEDAVRTVLGLSDGLRVLALVALGHKGEHKEPRTDEDLDASRRLDWDGRS